MPFSSVVDWLTMTWAATHDLSQIIPSNEEFEIVREMKKPRAFYDRTYQIKCGGFISTSMKDKQGIMLDLSGQPLQALRSAGFSSTMQLALAHNARRVTRLDYALDAREEDVKYCPESVWSNYKRGRIKTRLGPNRIILNTKKFKGRSVYWGSEDADVQVRAYDKAAEMKLENQRWFRLELQIRGRQANALSWDMYDQGMDIAGMAKMKKVFTPVPEFWLYELVNRSEFNPTRVPRKETSFKRWIDKSIRPAFEKHMLIEDDKLLIYQLFQDIFPNDSDDGYS